MRVTKHQLNNKQEKALDLLAETFGFTRDLIADMYGVIAVGASTVIPVQEVEKRAVEDGEDVKKILQRRALFHTALTRSKLFKSLHDAYLSLDPRDVDDFGPKLIERALRILRLSVKRTHSSKCSMCPHAASCEYGKVILKQGDYRKFLGAGKLSVHAGCLMGLHDLVEPTEPEKYYKDDAEEQQALSLHRQAVTEGLLRKSQWDPQTVQFAEDGSGYGYHDGNPTFTGAMNSLSNFEHAIAALTQKDSLLMELAATLEDEDGLDAHREVRNRTQRPAQENDNNRMREVHDAKRAKASDLAKPKEVVAHSIATRSLNVRNPVDRHKVKQLAFLLVDVSGSMAAAVVPNGFGLVTRGSIASAVCLAVIKRAQENQVAVFHQTFANHVGAFDYAHPDQPDTFDSLRHKVFLCDYNGGGTNLTGAVTGACATIEAERAKHPELTKADLILVTDAAGSTSETLMAEALKKAKVSLNTLHITAGNRQQVSGSDRLRKVSDAYVTLDPANLNLNSVATLVRKV